MTSHLKRRVNNVSSPNQNSFLITALSNIAILVIILREKCESLTFFLTIHVNEFLQIGLINVLLTSQSAKANLVKDLHITLFVEGYIKSKCLHKRCGNNSSRNVGTPVINRMA